ncbi:MAG TPA: flagellar biosynthetic protein FliO [Bacteroidota bacterium]|nr:flagellar biosynthetic protein FliO [Bacteroidota bacterium]
MDGLILRSVLSLGAILALMLGLTWLAKRYLRPGKGPRRQVVDVELLGQRSLQPRSAVYVLKVLNRVIVVGASEHGMQALAEFDDRETLALLEDAAATRPAPGWFAGADIAGGARSFAEYLRHQIAGARMPSLRREKNGNGGAR